MDMKKISVPLALLIMAWFAISTAAIFWIASASKMQFDPNMRLSQAIMSLSFEHDVAQALAGIGHTAAESTAGRPTIYHFTQGDCYCEYLASAHQSTMQNWSQEKGFLNVSIDISVYPQLAQFIPSTPAIVAVSATNTLIYIGPYSRGSGCFANTSDVDTYLRDWHTQNASAGVVGQAIIDTDASGCYCQT